ncbi:beta-galactosidase [Actinoplanes sp. OR16]|uniref:glycoside hydrolase family 35 protein n=1 Tax=Actinoplanes sp. OR16 TaxID=946334 RepID=UPI000F6F7DCE|nr:beta-galactosidase family protein [Actinoplanes sp. OR16]BBH68430.1 beta-galactosidase [Actinoplanes sp. OR16]
MFTAEGEHFRRQGREHRVLSGGLHYFRVHPAQWEHRLRMLLAMGLNTVETYVPWNRHEPREGSFAFEGELGGFLDLAAGLGLDAIVRPGPYICAEWDNGGLPSWLTARVGRRIRTSDPEYLAAVDAWFDRLIPVIRDRQITRGGTVIMVQVENEYGSYGSDRAYLRHLADGLTARGIEVPLFTSDGPDDFMTTAGTLPGVLTTVNFGSDPERSLAAASSPRMCMEFWDGWFDHWGDEHVTRDPADAADVLDRLLREGASVNLYMAHGGTNFGTTAGANLGGAHHDGAFQPTVTSYDYDAPISERGAPTEKFWRFREILIGHGATPGDLPPLPATLPPVTLTALSHSLLYDVKLPSSWHPVPPAFEDLGVDHGLVRYRFDIPGPRAAYPLTVDGLHDRAHVVVDGELRGILERDGVTSIDVTGPATVDLLVESMGRVNYGPRVGERKGIVGGVRHERQFVHGFTAYPLDLETCPRPEWAGDGAPPGSEPAFFRFALTVAEPADAFVALPDWGKGYVWVNGFGLGRFWDRGPQQTLYLPWPLLHAGVNEIVVLELDGRRTGEIEIRAEAALG